MPDTRLVSGAAARRYLVKHHLLAPPRAVTAGPAGVMRVFDALGSIQFDPLAVAGRNHDLVLHARVAGYEPAWTDALLYERRTLFEAHNKALCLLPLEELPAYRIAWDRGRVVHERGTMPDHQDLATHILDRIRTEGPLSSRDFEREPAIDWYWGPTNRVRAILEALWESGVIGLARRDGNRRYYDLVERLYPARLLAVQLDEREQLRHKLLSRHRANGLLGDAGPAELWSGLHESRRDGRRVGAALRAELRQELVAAGALVPVTVEGVRGGRYIPADRLAHLEQAQDELARGAPVGDGPPAVTFLAPLDPLVWDRDLLRLLFGFDYVWEVYVPEARRRWGYYVLPLLFGDRLVGRIEPRIDRRAGTVTILGLWWEPGFAPRRSDGFVAAARDALAAYLAFAGARDLRWAGATQRWARLLTPSRRILTAAARAHAR
ncbi:MAG: DNA glycosylase AlkZ-like family protein [Candidatus Limnocylindrales bacterium]